MQPRTGRLNPRRAAPVGAFFYETRTPKNNSEVIDSTYLFFIKVPGSPSASGCVGATLVWAESPANPLLIKPKNAAAPEHSLRHYCYQSRGVSSGAESHTEKPVTLNKHCHCKCRLRSGRCLSAEIWSSRDAGLGPDFTHGRFGIFPWASEPLLVCASGQATGWPECSHCDEESWLWPAPHGTSLL